MCAACADQEPTMTTGTGRCRIETGFGVDDVRVCVYVWWWTAAAGLDPVVALLCVDVYTLGIHTHA